MQEFCYPTPGSQYFRPIDLTPEEEEAFSSATVCYLCGKGKQYTGAYSFFFFGLRAVVVEQS